MYYVKLYQCFYSLVCSQLHEIDYGIVVNSLRYRGIKKQRALGGSDT